MTSSPANRTALPPVPPSARFRLLCLHAHRLLQLKSIVLTKAWMPRSRCVSNMIVASTPFCAGQASTHPRFFANPSMLCRSSRICGPCSAGIVLSSSSVSSVPNSV